MKGLKNWFQEKKISKTKIKYYLIKRYVYNWFMVPYFKDEQRQIFINNGDPIRYSTIYLAIETIIKENINGAIAECGVYRGQLSKFIHNIIPDKKFYLFDTFNGFDSRDSESNSDNRFKDTSLELVQNIFKDSKNVIIRQGYFPETINGIEDEIFSFVMIDFDKYEPTLSALNFFYPRVQKGGYIIIHDYNSPESNWACNRAVNQFLSDKLEKIITIPDMYCSALFRKIN